MIANRTGFEATNEALWISKDPAAKLVYEFDWSEWLDAGDELITADYAVVARRNDPEPILITRSGIDGTDKTFVELSGGQADKVYIVTVTISTSNGLIDARQFRIRVENRSA